MHKENITFKDTNYFSKLICDYLEEHEDLKPFYGNFPSLNSFKDQLESKKTEFTTAKREVLHNSIKQQYVNIETSKKTASNILSLQDKNTFTVTTGHQLNLFSGPLYFLYKILSTINLCEQLQTKYSDFNFVPIYWMATEDHDFVEINHFSLKGKKIVWNKKEALTNEKGGVGRFSTEGLVEVFEVFKKEIGIGNNAKELIQLFENTYLKHQNLAEATRYFVNQLFGKFGLVIVDGDDAALKKLFVPTMEQEFIDNIAFTEVDKTNKTLAQKGYKIQVNPREINLFYLNDGLRERIEASDNGSFKVLSSNFSWSSYDELKKELDNNPERFSPNVLLRPVYQETILPNLCYIGGGGELAYWLQLKSTFQKLNVTFPLLQLRNSALLISEKQQNKLEKLEVSHQQLFKKQFNLINTKVRQISNISIDFSEQRKVLENQFSDLFKIAEQTDKSFKGAVDAQKHKQLKGLDTLEKRLLKAQRIKLKGEVSRITTLQNQLFPQQSLQERKSNFSEFYLEYGEDLIQNIKDSLDPLKNEFYILKLD